MKQLKTLQLTRTFKCHLLNLPECPEQTSKKFEIAHF